MRRPAIRWLSLSLALIAVAGAGLAQQRYRLRDIDLPGDLSRVESEMEMSLDVQAKANGQEIPAQKFSNHEWEKYSEEVLSVDKKGPSGLRRIYSVSRSVETDPAGGEKEHVSSLQGKTVAIRRHGGAVVVTATPGRLADEDRKSLLDDLDNTDAAFFPDHDVAPGDEWSVDPKVARLIFAGLKSAEIRCQFQEVTEYAGHRCARLHMTLDLAGHPEGMPGELQMKLAGDGYFALDLERPLALDLAGPITMQGQTKENGTEVAFTGEGTFKAKESRFWQKVSGKPGVAKD